MIKEVIFDCFGVLTEDGWLAFLRKYGHLAPEGTLEYADHAYDIGQININQFIEEVYKLTAVDKDEIVSMVAVTQSPNYEVLKIAQSLKGIGYKLGIISNVGVSLDTVLPKDSLSIFDEITLSYQVGVAKPSEAIFTYHLDKVGFSPSEVIFIDDREVNCQSAQSIGINSIWFNSTAQLRQELLKYNIDL